MLSGDLEVCLNQAFHQARSARHEFLTVEHLLLGLLDAPKVREVLKGCGADLEALVADLKQYVDATTPQLSVSQELDAPSKPTLGFQRVLQRAVFHVQSSGKKEVDVVNVLVAIFSEKASYAALVLAHAQVTRLDVVHFNSNGITRIPGHTAGMDAAGFERLVEALLSLQQLIEQAARVEEEERVDCRELIDDLIAVARSKRPNGMKLRGLLAGLASGVAARVEWQQAWRQVRDAGIALDAWIIE
jgi:ATP-dependent Clp protease ATP-binding subunit ClpA